MANITYPLGNCTDDGLTPDAGSVGPALVDDTTGTPGTTLDDVGAVPSQANINNNFATLAAKVEAMRQVMIASGIAVE